MASKKLFISMRTDDKSRDEILQLREYIAAAVAKNINEKFTTQDEFTLIEPYLDSETDNLVCVSENIKRLNEADFAIFFDDWKDVRECNIERFCAEAYGIQCINVELAKKGGE